MAAGEGGRRVADGRAPGAVRGLLSDQRWRKNLIVGALIASTGVIGLWAIGEYAVDIQKIVFKQHFEQAGVPANEIRRAGRAGNQ